jgi:hypothetical protein
VIAADIAGVLPGGHSNGSCPAIKGVAGLKQKGKQKGDIGKTKRECPLCLFFSVRTT